MAKGLPFHPRAGQVLVCDFRDFHVPEMTKLRPVVVFSKRLAYRSQLVTVVPLSTTAPIRDLPFVHRLSKNYAPWGDAETGSWAKCDYLATVSLQRLSAFKVGRRKYVTPQLTPEDLAAVRRAVLIGLGLDGH